MWKIVGTIVGVIALAGVGAVGYLGRQEIAALQRGLDQAGQSLQELQQASQQDQEALEALRARVDQDQLEAQSQFETLESQGQTTQRSFEDRLTTLDNQIAEKLLTRVRRDEISSVLEDYRNETIRRAARDVVYVINDNSTGSGFFINDVGRVLTNCHVVGKARTVDLMTWDEHWVEAEVVARDAVTDVAVLQVIDRDVAFLRGKDALPRGVAFADSDAVQVGDSVFAMGAPHRLTRTVNAGQVSNTTRYLQGMPNLDTVSGLFNLYIQIDAGVMPGNSGGPSFDSEGRVIGINTRANQQNEAEGFLIPINFAMDRVEALLQAADGANHYNTLGFDIFPYLRRTNEKQSPVKILPEGYECALQVGRVFTDSPAYRRGFRTGCLIIEINDRPVDLNVEGDVVGLRRDIAFGEPGTQYTFKVKQLPQVDSRSKMITQEGRIETISLRVLNNDEYSLPVPIATLRAYFQGLAEAETPEGYEDGVKFVDQFTHQDMRQRIRRGMRSVALPFRRGDRVVEVDGEPFAGVGGLETALQDLLKLGKLPESLTIFRGDKKAILKMRQGGAQKSKPTPTTTPKPERKTEIF